MMVTTTWESELSTIFSRIEAIKYMDSALMQLGIHMLFCWTTSSGTIVSELSTTKVNNHSGSSTTSSSMLSLLENMHASPLASASTMLNTGHETMLQVVVSGHFSAYDRQVTRVLLGEHRLWLAFLPMSSTNASYRCTNIFTRKVQQFVNSKLFPSPITSDNLPTTTTSVRLHPRYETN